MRPLLACALLILHGKQKITNGKAWCILLCGNICKHVDAMGRKSPFCDICMSASRNWKRVRLLLSFIEVSLGSFQIAFRNDWAGKTLCNVSKPESTCIYYKARRDPYDQSSMNDCVTQAIGLLRINSHLSWNPIQQSSDSSFSLPFLYRKCLQD